MGRPWRALLTRDFRSLATLASMTEPERHGVLSWGAGAQVGERVQAPLPPQPSPAGLPPGRSWAYPPTWVSCGARLCITANAPCAAPLQGALGIRTTTDQYEPEARRCYPAGGAGSSGRALRCAAQGGRKNAARERHNRENVPCAGPPGPPPLRSSLPAPPQYIQHDLLPEDVVGVGAGHYSSFAVTSQGHLWSWGRAKVGWAGRARRAASATLPASSGRALGEPATGLGGVPLQRSAGLWPPSSGAPLTGHGSLPAAPTAPAACRRASWGGRCAKRRSTSSHLSPPWCTG